MAVAISKTKDNVLNKTTEWKVRDVQMIQNMIAHTPMILIAGIGGNKARYTLKIIDGILYVRKSNSEFFKVINDLDVKYYLKSHIRNFIIKVKKGEDDIATWKLEFVSYY